MLNFKWVDRLLARYLPYFYTRIFEYTETPIVFNFFGDLYAQPCGGCREDFFCSCIVSSKCIKMLHLSSQDVLHMLLSDKDEHVSLANAKLFPAD